MSFSSSSDEQEHTATPPEIVNAAQVLNENLLPAKSKDKYNAAYETFLTWKKQKKATSFSENVLLAYFGELADKYKPSSLWAIYSMLKATLRTKNCVNIEQFLKLKAFLKQKSDGYVGKKSKILSADHVEQFINEAPDEIYLATKVALILGVTGALRRQELSDITINDITDHGEMFLIKIPHTKNKVPRSFVVSGDYYNILNKYKNLRSSKATNSRFFQQYRNGKCIAQVIGKNKLGNMPREIAQYLNLPDATSYTGHSFRRTSATLLADAGADLLTLKRHGGWKSSNVAEGYIDDSINNKKKISEQITKSLKSEPINTVCVSAVASTSSAVEYEEPVSKKPRVEINNSSRNVVSESRDPPSPNVIENTEQIFSAYQDKIEQDSTTNITNLSQSIKLPEKNLVLNLSNISNSTITFNFNK